MHPTDRQAPSSYASHRLRARARAAPTTATSAAAAAVNSSCVGCESYLRLKKKGALTWSTRFFVLRNAQLACFYAKQDADLHRGALEVWQVTEGHVTKLRGEVGLTIVTKDGTELAVRAFNRGELAKWLTAFHRLDVKRESKQAAVMRVCDENVARSPTTTVSSSDGEESDTHDENEAKPKTRRVTFHGSVLVRTIPTIPDEQIPELFYSRKEMEQFSLHASSLLSRTESAMNRAFLSLRRPKATA